MPLDFSTGRQPLSAFSLTGMTDIVLLLLIFFLLTSTFVAQYGIQVTLPQVAAAAPPEDRSISVTITADGRYFVDATETAPQELEAALVAAAPGRDAVVLRADQDARVRQFAEVASAARVAGLRVLMATEPLERRR
jgi:biopolymer transport protein ExbD